MKAKHIQLTGKISIHAPREGSDWAFRGLHRNPKKFLSTLPARGATRRLRGFFLHPWRFLSTLPARGATAPRRGQ